LEQTVSRYTGWIPALLCYLVATAPSIASGAQPAPPDIETLPNVSEIVSQLVQRNQSRAARLKHYEGCRYYSLDYIGFPSNKTAEMVVGTEYNAPSEKQFHVVRQEGARWLLNKVLKELLINEKEAAEDQHRNSIAVSPENYEFRPAGSDVINGRPQYVLEIIPKVRSKYLYQGKVWVDTADFAVSRISAQPAKNPSIWISHTQIEHEYKKIGEFWLPARNVSVTKVRLGGTATLKINYLNYVIGGAKKTLDDNVCRNLPPQLEISEKQ
jgi:hypothetical protein